MPTGGPFPTKNSEFNDYSNTVTPYLNANAVRLSVSGANLTILNTFYDNPGVVQNDLGWKQLWALNINDDTTTKTISDLVRIRRTDMEDTLRLIYGDIPKSALTVSDRNTLNIPLRDSTPTPVPVLTFAPDVEIDETRNGVQVLRVTNPQTPDTDAMPPNQKAELQTFVGAANIPDNNIAFVGLKTTSKHLNTVNFLPAQKGQTAYYRGRYVNPKGEQGPWSDVTSEIIL